MRIRRILSRCPALLALLISVSCNDSGGDSAPPVGPDIRGHWTGVYYRETGGGEVRVNAEIEQEGDAVIITTDKPTPPAQRFTGTISNDGDLHLTDAYDGEIWTSHGTPATHDHIRIVDFLWMPSPEDPDPPLQVLDLTRADT